MTSVDMILATIGLVVTIISTTALFIAGVNFILETNRNNKESKKRLDRLESEVSRVNTNAFDRGRELDNSIDQLSFKFNDKINSLQNNVCFLEERLKALENKREEERCGC